MIIPAERFFISCNESAPKTNMQQIVKNLLMIFKKYEWFVSLGCEIRQKKDNRFIVTAKHKIDIFEYPGFYDGYLIIYDWPNKKNKTIEDTLTLFIEKNGKEVWFVSAKIENDIIHVETRHNSLNFIKYLNGFNIQYKLI